MALVAYVLGARIIEKHFTLNRAMKGTDHAFSLEPDGMRKLVRDLNRAKIALGNGEKKQYESEQVPLRKMGKMIISARDILKGEEIRDSDLEFRSPAEGMFPFEREALIGKRTRTRILKGQILRQSDVK